MKLATALVIGRITALIEASIPAAALGRLMRENNKTVKSLEINIGQILEFFNLKLFCARSKFFVVLRRLRSIV